ncbi:hypothetical protein CRENBAI_009596 [Crenichthys baileyi]|uniref:Uncharacterized protein n=1 Tax=Crenichthys baileyi TaxID=28760 RepID=A0AAV9RFY2_9TELE
MPGILQPPLEKSRGESQGKHPAATLQKPRGAAAMSPQTLPAAIYARADLAMDPETRDPGTHDSPSRGHQDAPRQQGKGPVQRHAKLHPQVQQGRRQRAPCQQRNPRPHTQDGTNSPSTRFPASGKHPGLVASTTPPTNPPHHRQCNNSPGRNINELSSTIDPTSKKRTQNWGPGRHGTMEMENPCSTPLTHPHPKALHEWLCDGVGGWRCLGMEREGLGGKMLSQGTSSLADPNRHPRSPSSKKGGRLRHIHRAQG